MASNYTKIMYKDYEKIIEPDFRRFTQKLVLSGVYEHGVVKEIMNLLFCEY